jgi:8-hydroxy-5-deazaflavin:NADPH oxidoreductase
LAAARDYIRNRSIQRGGGIKPRKSELFYLDIISHFRQKGLFMGKKTGIIGSGSVGVTFANGLIKHGYDVMIGTGNTSKHDALREQTSGKAAVGTFEEAARFGELIVFCTKGISAEAILGSISAEALKDKVVIDTTNPSSETAPVNGVMEYFTSYNESLMERLQRIAPGARFVKAFNSVGYLHMVDPDFGGVKPTMFICGNDSKAKTEAVHIVEAFGWEAEDMGAAESARAIEPLCILWCIPGFRENRWMHAFKLLTK